MPTSIAPTLSSAAATVRAAAKKCVTDRPNIAVVLTVLLVVYLFLTLTCAPSAGIGNEDLGRKTQGALILVTASALSIALGVWGFNRFTDGEKGWALTALAGGGGLLLLNAAAQNFRDGNIDGGWQRIGQATGNLTVISTGMATLGFVWNAMTPPAQVCLVK